MLSTISWSQYMTFLLVATVIYYIFIWIYFFKGKLSLLPGVSGIRQFSVQGEDEPDEVLTTAQHILDELRPVFDDRTNKNELLYALQSKLKKYSGWEEPGFQQTINEFIQQESLNKCSVRLSEDDLRRIWP